MCEKKALFLGEGGKALLQLFFESRPRAAVEAQRHRGLSNTAIWRYETQPWVDQLQYCSLSIPPSPPYLPPSLPASISRPDSVLWVDGWLAEGRWRRRVGVGLVSTLL